MELTKAISERYSCRSFSPQKVAVEKLQQLATLAGGSPSAANKQAYRVSIITEKDELEKCYLIYAREWLKTAPAIMLICANLSEGWIRADGKNHAEIDTAIYIDHLTLLATDAGLATCWVCNFNRELCRELFGLPSSLEPMVLLPIGFPKDAAIPSKKRKDANEWLFVNQIPHDKL
ncbi:MAG: nitroreductase family protein [Salinivirgaceae bacterium]|nr:nitroreductase family protein [Salinivirgaceae bacterium]